MTKTLTEQWKDGELESGWYYIKDINNEIYIAQHYTYGPSICLDGEDILSPVPSYDEWKRLQEQLNEANEVIKKYATGTTQIKAKKYEGSFYITDPFTGEQRRIEDWGEEYDADVPMSNDDKPAKAYLEKWGVK